MRAAPMQRETRGIGEHVHIEADYRVPARLIDTESAQLAAGARNPRSVIRSGGAAPSCSTAFIAAAT
jgi:hypothetical protein